VSGAVLFAMWMLGFVSGVCVDVFFGKGRRK